MVVCPISGSPCDHCAVKVPTIGEAVAQLIESKVASGLSAHYIRSLKDYLNQFARGRESQGLETVASLQALEDWFAGRREAPTVRKSNTGRLSALFQFAFRRGWLAANPVRRLEPVRHTQLDPVIFQPSQVRALMNWVQVHRPELVGWLALTFFCGLRPEEARRLTWADIRLSEKVVIVRAAACKTHRRRVVPIGEAAERWLWLLDREKPICPPLMTLRRARREACDALGLTWHQDVARHSAATYWLAKTQNAPQVALWLGNSPVMLARHYANLCEAGDAVEYWSIYPVGTPDDREIAA